MTQAEAVALETGQGATLVRAARGDAEAFADLVRRHQRMVFSICWNFFPDRALAEDLAQEVFLQLFQNLHQIETESHLVFWLRQVATRKCIDHTRRQDYRKNTNLDDVAEFHPEVRTEAAVEDVFEQKRLRRLVASLPEKFRAVVVLRFQEELSPTEIAQVLGWPVNSVKSRLHRALRMLRDRLEN